MIRTASRICWSDGENARPCQSATMVLLESPRPSPTRPGAKWLRLAALMPRTTGVRVCTGRTARAHVDPLGVARDQRHDADRVVARDFPGPGRVVAARFSLAGDGQELGGRQRREGREDDAETRGCHASVLTASRAAFAAPRRKR